MPKQINSEQFHELTANPSSPIIIDFYADWCQPCKMVLPILQNLKQEAKGKIHFYKINVDENPDIVEFLAISSVPSFLFIPTQGEKKFHSGAIPASVFKAKIKEHLNITLQN